MIPIVVFASGRGTNFDAIQRSIEAKTLEAEVKAVVSDQPDALVLKKARDANIPVLVFPFPRGSGSLAERRQDHEKQILKEILPLHPRFLVLAGYMRIITRDFIEAFRSEKGYSRIVNIHPSLLPAFPGVHSYAQAYRYGAHVAGVTVHLVEPSVDSGPICAQEAFSIADCQSEEEVEKRGLEIEHRLFPQTLRWVLPEAFSIESRKKLLSETDRSETEWRICVRSH